MIKSNEPTLAQMNYAILKFMGYEKVTVGYSGTEEETEWQRNHEEWMNKVGIENVGDYIVDVPNHKWHHWEDVKYHTSWDWLMPVVRKIKYDNSSVIRMESNGISDSIMPYIHAMQPMNRSLIKADLAGTHVGAYQFTQWYNLQKQNNGTTER